MTNNEQTITKQMSNEKTITTMAREANSGKKIIPHTGLDSEAREKISGHVARFLAETYSLMLKYQNYHWNVKGMSFVSIHELTETHYREIFEAVDEIAEKIRSLGFRAPGSFHMFDLLSEMDEPNGNYTAEEMIGDLVLSNERLVTIARDMVEDIQELNDEATADLIISRMQVHEKNAWLWRSFLEA